MGKVEHYEQAIVPEYLTKLTIEKLPLDEAFYISPGERDDFDPPAVFVGPDRRLKMGRSYAIDIDDDCPTTPLGLVGVMRVALVDSEVLKLKECYIADLRFMEYHSLIDTDEMVDSMIDQEAYMAYLATLEDSVQFDAFIALDEDYEFDVDKKIPGGTFYGSPDLHHQLKLLQKRSNKIMKRFMKLQAKPTVEEKDPTLPQPPVKSDQPAKPAADLSVKFSSAQQ